MRILIAEDERITRQWLRRLLEQLGHEVVDADNGERAWELFQANPFSIVISDWVMPKMSGLELVQRVRRFETDSYVYIVMLTGKSDKKDVVEGIEAGADDFVSKPFDRDELRARLAAGQRIVELEHRLANTNQRLQHELAVARELSNVEHDKHEEFLLGNSIPMRALRDGVLQFSGNDEPLLLSGPSGSGHEAVARAVHRASTRRGRAFIYVACPHISELNSTVYGFDASPNQRGKASLADGGTLFLESVDAMSDSVQSQLAQFLLNAQQSRAAGLKPAPDVRVIASVSSDFDRGRRSGRIRKHLSELLGVHRLTVPPLVDRRDDILTIAASVLDRSARSSGKPIEGFTLESETRITEYSWPGNIRELQSVVERAVLLSTGANVDVPEEFLREGRRVGGYTLRSRLGQGGMGEVWLAEHSLLARPSAVKLIRQSAKRQDDESKEMLIERFQREAKATAQLRSPNTVELYDFGITDERDFYYVMEFLDGVNLYSFVKRFGQLPPERVVYLLQQACSSLSEAHQAGLVHRDVKPDNLFLCQLGTQFDFLKLLDFGIVRITTGADQTGTSKEGEIKGTPSCISPEAARGEPTTYASDIYGLGCVAYWLLTGRHVFMASNVTAMLVKHVTEPPVPPSQLGVAMPSQLSDLVISCLAKNPTDRPRDGRELSERLAEIPLPNPWSNQRAAKWWSQHTLADSPPVTSSDTAPAVKTELEPVLVAGHIGKEMLAQWVRGELSAKRSAAVEEHLEVCDDCAIRIGQVDQTIADNAFINRVRDILG